MRRKTLTDEQRYLNKKEYVKQYVKKTYVLQVGLKKDRDADIIEFLESVPTGTKRDYIRQLIREDMQKRSK